MLTKIGILFVLTFLLGGRDIVAQEEGRAEVYTMADTVRAKVMLEEALKLLSKDQIDEALALANQSKRIYIQLYGDEGHMGISDAWSAIGIVYSKNNIFESAVIAFLDALRIAKKLVGENHLRISVLSNNIGVCYRKLEDFHQTLKYLKQSEHVFLYNKKESTTAMASLQNNIGRTYFSLGDYQEAAKYAQRSIETSITIQQDRSLTAADAFNLLANCYSTQGDFSKAILLYDKSLQIFQKETGEQSERYSNVMNNIGICYLEMGDYETALKYHRKAIANREAIANNSQNCTQSYINISSVYRKMGYNDTTLLYLRKALDLASFDSTVSLLNMAYVLGNMGRCKIALLDSESAKEDTERSISMFKKIFYNLNHPDIILATLNLGSIYAQQSLLDSAKTSWLQALSMLGYYKSDPFSSAEHLSLLTHALSNLGDLEALWYRTSHEPSHLYQSYTFFKQSLYTFDKIAHTLNITSKSPLYTQSAEISSNAIATNQLLFALTDSIHYLHESFDYAERSKAYLLYEAMQEADALHIAGIPDSLLDQEYDLRVEIAYFDKRKQEKLSSGTSETDSTVLAIGSKLFDLKRTHETLIQRFESDYPQYYQAKYGLKTASIEEVQQSLSPQQTMLQYVLGDSSIFLFLVQKNHLEVQEIKKDFPLERWVDSLTRHGIYGYHTLPITQKTPSLEAKTIHNYTHAAQALYDKLIAPVKTKLSPELIIIPDGVLGYIPFETLLTKAPGRKGNFASYPFLLNEHQISYCYSATLLREMREKQHRKKSKKTVLALAPFFRGDLNTLNARVDTTELFALRDSLGTLPASGDEAALISKIWNGMPIYGAAASLDTFQSLANQYQILHLSTHGKADDRVGDYAYLALGAANNPQDYDKLYARDLYNLELNAELVVLSACETGIGKLRRGEGIVSLARAFAYAGAKSIVTSLWKVDDSKTKDLLVDFYQHLKSGKTKDAALQQAKLDFLTKNRAGGGDAMHPFFWAGFIAIGDMGAVKQ